MTPIKIFSLQQHKSKYEDRPLKSYLYVCGNKTELQVSGYEIEKQFELADYYLLLLNWDCLFEEGCEVVILNKQIKLVATYSFTPFYNSFLLTDFNELSNNCYELIFNQFERFELTINYPKKQLLSKVIKVRKFT